jgi:hypothetical protein
VSKQRTSAAIPDYDPLDARGRVWVLRDLQRPGVAAVFFRTLDLLDALDGDDLREFARAYARTFKRVPGWMDDVLVDESGPAAGFRAHFEGKSLGFVGTHDELRALGLILREQPDLLEGALERLRARRWEGRLEVYDADGDLVPLSRDAMSAVSAWEKERLLRELDGGASDEWAREVEPRLLAFFTGCIPAKYAPEDG